MLQEDFCNFPKAQITEQVLETLGIGSFSPERFPILGHRRIGAQFDKIPTQIRKFSVFDQFLSFFVASYFGDIGVDSIE